MSTTKFRRDRRGAVHYAMPETTSELIGNDVDPLRPSSCLESMDNDPTIDALLAAENL